MYHNPRDPESWCIKGTDESTLDNNLSGPLIHHDLSDIANSCATKEPVSLLWNSKIHCGLLIQHDPAIHDLESGTSKDPISPIGKRIHYTVHTP